MPSLPRFAELLRPQSHRFALESRQLFDGAAHAVAESHHADALDPHRSEAPPPPPPPPPPAPPPAPRPAPAAGTADHAAEREAPRTLAVADLAANGNATGNAAKVASATAATAATAATSATTDTHTVYVIDENVADYQQIVSALPKGSEVILIDPNSDGVAQLAAALKGQTGITDLSIISHGAAGEITLGTTTITAANIGDHAAAWQSIGASLGANGDILLYGCDVASQGNGLLTQIAGLTGADVAASTDATGAASKGGDWTLEASVGHIESKAFSDPGYDGLLAQPTVATTATKLQVAEPSTLDAPGADSGRLSGWTVADASGNVTVTVSVDSLVNGVADGTPDTAVGGLTAGATGTAVASLSFTGTVADANTWLNNVTFHATDVELGNTAAQATLKVVVTDSAQPTLSATQTLPVTVTPSNDPTVIGNSTTSVAEVGSTVLTVATLNALDPEVDAPNPTQTPSQIVYSVTAEPGYGYLTVNGTRLGVGSVFTQADVIAGNVVYVHTATGASQDTPDSFGVSVNDGATPANLSDHATITLNITPLNQPPTVSGSGSMLEGQPANAHDGSGNVLSDVGAFITASGGGDDADSTLSVKLTALPTDGTLYYSGTAIVGGVTETLTNHAITSADVAAGFSFAYTARDGLTYGNNGNRDQNPATPYPFSDGFNVVVTDGGGGTGTPASTADTRIAIDVRPTDDDPVLTTSPTPVATVTAAGDGLGVYKGSYTTTITPALLNATDVDSSDSNLTFAVTSQAGLNQGILLVNGAPLGAGGVFTMAEVRAGEVQYVQQAGAAAGDTDNFSFQVLDNTTSVRWNSDGSSVTRPGGVYQDNGTPGNYADDTLQTFNLTINLVPTPQGNGDSFSPPPSYVAVHTDSSYAGTDTTGASRGTLDEGGTVVLAGTGADFTTTPGLSYTVDGVPASQVVYTVLAFNGAGPNWNGELQKLENGTWVDLNVYDTFTQADLNAGDIRYQHNGTSEDFQSSVVLSASAGVLVGPVGSQTPDNWTTSFNFYVHPLNDAPVVTGSSNTVLAEGQTIGITSGQLQITDQDDAVSESYLEGPSQGGTGGLTLPGGGNNYAYNNDATGAGALKFEVETLPAGGTLQYSTDGGATWLDVVAGVTQIDASVLTANAATTGLRFVSNGGETRNASFSVEAIDRWGAVSNTATVSLQITNVDDAPTIASDPTQPDPTVPGDSPNLIGGAPQNNPLTVAEGSAGRITPALLQAYDPDSDSTQVQYSITSAPANGYLAYSTNGGASYQVLGVNSSFTQADVAAGRIYYVSNGSESSGATYPTGQDDKFTFTVSDGAKEQTNNQFWIYTTPTNDAPVVKGPGGPIAIDSLIPADNPVTGFTVTDPDLVNVTSGEQDFIEVTVRLRDANGNALPDSVYNGVSIAVTTSAAGLVDGTENGAGTYLVLHGTVEDVQSALSTLTVTFADDRNTAYQLQVIADDRLRNPDGSLAGGANGGALNQSATPLVAPVAVPTTVYDWGHDDIPTSGAILGDISSQSVLIYASSVNQPATLTATGGKVSLEDQASYIGGGFAVADPESDGFGTPVTVTLSVPSGTLGIGGSGIQTSVPIDGRTVTVAGDNTGTLVLTGRAGDIQDLLNSGTATGLTYQSALNVNHDLNGAAAGDVTVTLSLNDAGSAIGGDTGSGSVSNNPPNASFDITITPTNDAPTVAVAGNRDTPVFLLGSTTPTAVGGLSVGDIDIAGDGGGVATGETDFVQATVRITTAAGTPLAADLYNGSNAGDVSVIVLGSTASATNPDGSGGAFAVDTTYTGNQSALVIRGTLSQVDAYLAGLTLSMTGAGVVDADTPYRVEVVADDRVRDVATGALVDSDSGTAGVQPIANGGLNPGAGNVGTANPPQTVVDPYAATPTGLTQDVASNYQTVFPTGINDPAHITGTPATYTEANPTITLTNIQVSDQDAQATSILTTTVSVPAGFSIVSVGAGSGGTAVISGDTRSIVLTGTLAQINSRIDTIAVQLPDPDGAGPAQRSDWNGSFGITVVVDDNGNSGARPATLAAGDNTTTGTFTYEDPSAGSTDNALVTTRTYTLTVNPQNDAPVLAGTTGTRTVVEYPNADNIPGTPGVQLVSTGTASLTDIDLTTTAGLTTFGAGTITVTLGAVPAGVAAGDHLTVSTPLPAGFTSSGGSNGAPLVISFGLGTTEAQIDQVIESMSYSSSSDNPTNFGANPTRSFSIVVNDGDNQQVGGANAGGPTALNSNALTGTIAITAVDDAPVANDDARHVTEDGPAITGNVIVGDANGDVADTDVDSLPAALNIAAIRTGTEAAGTGTAGAVGAALAGSYGSLVLNANGSYTYTLDNANPAVNALKTGQTLTETYTYTLSDGAGGTDTAQITITIDGHTDGAPSITPVDGNGAVAGQATVYEAGLTTDGPAGESRTVAGTVHVSAPDGLASISVGGTTVTAAQLGTLGTTPVVIDTGEGLLTLTGYAAGSGTLSYSYTLKAALNQPGTDTLDNIALGVTDLGAAPLTGTATGTLAIDIVNDVPTARPDTNAITEDAAPATVAGNVVTNDRLGADGAATTGPVTAVSHGATAGTLGANLATTYGSIVVNADGSYVYTLDNNNVAVNALKTGQSLNDVVSYTVTDRDGDTSTTNLTITIAGHTDGPPSAVPADANGADPGQVTVYEAGLTTDGPAGESKTASGTIAVSAADGLQSVSVGGTVLTSAQLANLSAGNPVSITTPDGTLLLTGFSVGSTVGGVPGGVPTAGTLSYTYTLVTAQHQTGVDSTDDIPLVVTDLSGAPTGGSATSTLSVRIVNDDPTAHPDTAAISEDAAPTVTGNVVTNDRIGADGPAAGGPVTSFGFGATTGAAGSTIATAFGTIQVNADGSYVYTLDNDNATVNALKTGQTLTEVVNYTITDGDGNSSPSTLTVTINGHSDGAPAITSADGNGAAAGEATVYEAGLTADGPAGESKSASGSISVSAPDGLQSVDIGGTTLGAAQLAALSPATPVTIATADGTLVLTGFTAGTVVGGVPTSGTLSYTYTLGAAQHQAGADSVDSIALSVTDRSGATTGSSAAGTLNIDIVNDVPTARPDTAAITEDAAPATVAGNVVTNDRLGADGAAAGGAVTGVVSAAGTGTVGASLATTYGAIVLNADGSYVYTLNNDNAAVNALKTGQSLSDVVTYTITDGDGNTSATTLTVTIAGHSDGTPTVAPVDANGADPGQVTVYEAGLTTDGPAGESKTASGTIAITAPDGLQSVSVGGTVLTTAQLATLSSGNPVSIATPDGTLLLTGFTPGTSVGGVPTAGTLSYTYTLGAAQHQTGVDSTDDIPIVVTDLSGAATGNTGAGTLSVRIVNDDPTAHPDTASVTEDGVPTVTGNVVTNDRIGADGPAAGGPVTSFGFGATSGTVGGTIATAFGTIQVNADGSYVYTLDNSNPTVNALKTGETLTEVVNYTITDSDGNSSPSTLTVTIDGHTDNAAGPLIVPVDGNGAAAGQVDVYEHGLTDGPAGPDTSERNTGAIAIEADDGLTSVTVGGTTLTAAQLQNLGTNPVTVHTPEGTLVLTGFTDVAFNGTVPVSGNLQYTYTLDGPVNQPGAASTIDPIALSILDAGGATSTGTLGVRVVNDVPVAHGDSADITEDGTPTVTGNVKANDVPGADNGNGVPVTGVAFGGSTGAVGTPLATAYGTVTINADGSYSYTLDNANPAVQHLIAGESLVETVNYTITDADGDRSTAALTLTIHGTDDVPTLALVDGNGGADGQASVSERGLTSPSDNSETTTGRFVVTAPDGLTGLVIDGTAVSPAQLANLGNAPLTLGTALGQMTLTGYDPATGTVSYSYTLGHDQDNAGGEVLDRISITVQDRGGATVTGSLGVLVLDDVPTANSDSATVSMAIPNATVSGNVVGGAGRGPGDVPDRIGADDTPTPVTGFSFDGHAGVVGGTPLAGAYGTLKLNADGSYTYSVDASNAKLAALGDGQTVTDVFSYTITDSDGSTSTARLVITIKGSTPPLPALGDDVWPSDFIEPTRGITQGMEPALFVQLAVRESQQLSDDLVAGVATRVAGGLAEPFVDGHGDDYAFGYHPLPDPGFVPAQHVLRDGVAFSQALVRDIELTEAMQGRGNGLPAHGSNALFGDFNGFTGERFVIAGAAPEHPPAHPHAAPSHRHAARSFTDRLHAAAADRGTPPRAPSGPQPAAPTKVRIAVPEAPR